MKPSTNWSILLEAKMAPKLQNQIKEPWVSGSPLLVIAVAVFQGLTIFLEFGPLRDDLRSARCRTPWFTQMMVGIVRCCASPFSIYLSVP